MWTPFQVRMPLLKVLGSFAYLFHAEKAAK